MRISKNGYLIRTTTSRVLKCILSVLVLLSLMTSCSSGKKFIVPSPLPDDRQTIPEPKDRRYNHVSDSFDKQFTKQIEQSFDLSRQLRHIFRSPKQAFNVNGFD